MALQLKADPNLQPVGDNEPPPAGVLDLREKNLRREYETSRRFVVEVQQQPLEEAEEQPLEEALVDRQSKAGSEAEEKVEEKSTKESAEIEKEFGGAANQEERELLQLHGIVKTEDERLLIQERLRSLRSEGLLPHYEEGEVSETGSSSTQRRVSFTFFKPKPKSKVFGRPVFG